MPVWSRSTGAGSGHRRYDSDALRRLLFLIRMRSSGMSIRDLHRYVQLVDQGPATVDERLDMMNRHRRDILDRIADLQVALMITEYKIDTYGGNCTP